MSQNVPCDPRFTSPAQVWASYGSTEAADQQAALAALMRQFDSHSPQGPIAHPPIPGSTTPVEVPGSEIPNEERYATWAGIGALLGFFVAPQLIGLRALTGAILGGAGGLYLGMEKQKKINNQVVRQRGSTPHVPTGGGLPSNWCPPGLTYIDGRCQPPPCPEGMVRNNNMPSSCVPVGSMGDPNRDTRSKCPPGQIYDNGVCRDMTGADVLQAIQGQF